MAEPGPGPSHRASVVETSARGRTFFEKLSGGFTAVQESVASLEELSEQAITNLTSVTDTPKSARKVKENEEQHLTNNDAFFAPESALLANFSSIYVSSTFCFDYLF